MTTNRRKGRHRWLWLLLLIPPVGVFAGSCVSPIVFYVGDYYVNAMGVYGASPVKPPVGAYVVPMLGGWECSLWCGKAGYILRCYRVSRVKRYVAALDAQTDGPDP